VSYTEQLPGIIRYILKDGQALERLLMFVPIEKHDTEYLLDTAICVLISHGIITASCRSQSYDNPSNMSGIYSGAQARFKKINKLSMWVPCAAHSLDFAGTTAAEKSV
jgi:hypothetical protein